MIYVYPTVIARHSWTIRHAVPSATAAHNAGSLGCPADPWRNGYRPRRWDTRVGTIELAVPKLRAGSYFPDWC